MTMFDEKWGLPDVPAARTPEGQRETQRIRRELEKMANEVEKVIVRVLIWGPGSKSTSALAQKRKDIKQVLSNKRFYAFFSEDLPSINDDLTLRTIELFHARTAHLIILLLETPGSIGELHDFADYPDIVPKLYIMSDQAHQGGYSGQGILKVISNQIYWYSIEEISECTVLTLAVKRALMVREFMYWQQQNKTGKLR